MSKKAIDTIKTVAAAVAAVENGSADLETVQVAACADLCARAWPEAFRKELRRARDAESRRKIDDGEARIATDWAWREFEHRA